MVVSWLVCSPWQSPLGCRSWSQRLIWSTWGLFSSWMITSLKIRRWTTSEKISTTLSTNPSLWRLTGGSTPQNNSVRTWIYEFLSLGYKVIPVKMHSHFQLDEYVNKCKVLKSVWAWVLTMTHAWNLHLSNVSRHYWDLPTQHSTPRDLGFILDMDILDTQAFTIITYLES